MSYLIEVFLAEIECIDTESLHSSDRALFNFAVATDSATAAESWGPMRINDGEVRLFQPMLRLFQGAAVEPKVAIAIQGLDLDENAGWEDSEPAREAAVQGIGALLDVLAAPTMAGIAWAVGMEAIQRGIGELIELDRADTIFETSKVYDAPGGMPYQRSRFPLVLRHRHNDPSGYSSSEYKVELVVQSTWMPSFGAVTPATVDDDAYIRDFRHRAEVARAQGFVGGYPNGHRVRRQAAYLGGTVFLNSSSAELRNVPLTALGSPPAGDFGEHMRAVQRYATSQGFPGGFPTFKTYSLARRAVREVESGSGTRVEGVAVGVGGRVWQTVEEGLDPWSGPFGRGGGGGVSGRESSPWEETVSGRAAQEEPTMGVVLLKPSHAEFRDVALEELGNPDLGDPGARFRAAADYAARTGFLGAFPTMFHAEYRGITVMGLIMIRHGAGEWQDVLLAMDPT